MNALPMALARTARRTAPGCVVVAALILSTGVCTGDARTIGHAEPRHNFTLALKSRAVTLRPGASARITVVIHRRHLPGVVRLGIASKLPHGLSAHFTPRKARGWHSVLTLRATSWLAPGRYVIKVRGSERHRVRTTRLIITVSQPARTGGVPGGTPGTASGSGSGTADAGSSFSITGDAGGALEPGILEPIDLEIENPNSASLTLNSLTAAVSSVNAPQATSSLPCTASDFAVQQYSGLLPLVVAPETRVSLQQLGVPQSEWPGVSMLDRTSNQDGCQGASLRLSYDASATLG